MAYRVTDHVPIGFNGQHHLWYRDDGEGWRHRVSMQKKG